MGWGPLSEDPLASQGLISAWLVSWARLTGHVALVVQPPLTTCPHARTCTEVLTPFCFCLTGHLCLEVSQVYFFNYSSRGDIDKCEGDGIGSEEREVPIPTVSSWTDGHLQEQILKAAREKKQITHKGIPIRITADLSIETLQARREWQGILKWWKKISYSPDYCARKGSHSNMKEKSKAFQTSKSWENFAPPNQLSNKY